MLLSYTGVGCPPIRRAKEERMIKRIDVLGLRLAAALLAMLAVTTDANAQWTVIDLGPAGSTASVSYGVAGGQQVGFAGVGGVQRASLWSGTTASWVDLNPAGSTASVSYGVGVSQQVGFAVVGGVQRASLWSGTSASWVDLNPGVASESISY